MENNIKNRLEEYEVLLGLEFEKAKALKNELNSIHESVCVLADEIRANLGNKSDIEKVDSLVQDVRNAIEQANATMCVIETAWENDSLKTE